MTATVAARVERGIVRVSGPDAEDYLQGQLSQDIVGLAAGSSAWSFLLQPQGRVDAWLRISRLLPEAFLLDVDGGWDEAVVARLERFKLRSKLDIEPLNWSMVAVRGPGSGFLDTAAEVVAPAAWPGIDGVDVLGPEVTVPEGVDEVAPGEMERLRIAHGVPRMGAELTEATIPAEAGAWVVREAVDFTKGCFTGQELVARIDSRGGNVPRQVRGLAVAGGATVSVGAPVSSDGVDVGVVTSSAPAVALAVLKRGTEPPAKVSVGTTDAQVAEFPLPLPG